MPEIQGPFRCAPHEFATDGTKPLPEQEDDWYQHLRDEPHDGNCNKPCQNCGKQEERKYVQLKVPQPTPDNKNPRSPIVFCDEKCKSEYLAKMGVTE